MLRCVEHGVEFVVGYVDEHGKPVRRCPACVERDRKIVERLMKSHWKWSRRQKQVPVVMVELEAAE